MIKVLVIMKGQNYRSIKAVGHANYSAPGVEDIVCASVSTIIQSVIVGIDQFSRYNNYSIKSGDLGVVLADDLTFEEQKAANIIIQTASLSINNIAHLHKDNVNLEFQEEQ